MKARALFALLASAALGLSVIHNRRIYRSRSWRFVIGKSLVDLALLALIVFALPLLLIGYSTAFFSEHIVQRTWQNRYWFITVITLVGIGFSALAGIAMEALVLLSVFPINIITGKILVKAAERRARYDQSVSLQKAA